MAAAIRRSAVDFVSQNDIGENWPGFPFKKRAVLVVHRQPNHVGRQQIRGELNTLKSTINRAREGMRKRRFPDARHVFNQQVAAGDQRDDGQPNRFGFAFDDGLDGVLQPLDLLDRVGAGYLSAVDCFEVSHQLACNSTCSEHM
jgi:hypothetical protein